MLNTKKGGDVFNAAMIEIMNPKEGIVIPEWKRFSRYTGGLRLNEFSIFSAPTGAGKTQFLANMTFWLASQGVKCFVAPVETGEIDFATRMLSVPAGLDLNTGDKFEMKDFKDAMGLHLHAFTENVFFSTHDNRVDVTEMIETLRYMVEVNGVKVAILDNLNFFLKPARANEQMLVADEAVHEFVMLAKKIPIHLWLVMHPRKTDGAKLLSEFDIKGTSTAVQEASNILLMNKPNQEELDAGVNPFSRELFFAKIRKRGFNAGKRFYLEYRAGGYFESLANDSGGFSRPATSTGNPLLRKAPKRAGVPDIAIERPEQSEIPF